MEEFKVAEGYSRYLIGSYGTVYDTKRNAVMAQWVDNVGYYMVKIWNDEHKRKYVRIHRMVAKAFVRNESDLPQVNHIDGNKLNNHYDNLEWIDNQHNTQHGYDNDLYHSKHRRNAVVVYDKNWNYIKTCHSIRSMCEEFHVNRKTVTAILKGTKQTNNYDYNFKYADESVSTIESIGIHDAEEASRVGDSNDNVPEVQSMRIA